MIFISNLTSFFLSKFIIRFSLFVIIFTSIYFGIKYTIYNQDYHHSFFILSMYIDSKNGFGYFDDIFLQYGPGQIILFNLIDLIFDINLISINNLNVILYSINFFVLFQIFKKISNEQISFLFIFIIFLIHPFSIYPWPDYLSGFCLSLFIYFFLKKNTKYAFLSSFFLFLAFFFRSTYLINISLSVICFSLFLLILNKNNPFKKEFFFFLLYSTTYLTILFLNESLVLWFNESLGIIGGYAQDTKHLELYEKITNYFGNIGFIFLKICYYFFRSLKNLLDPTNSNNYIFIFCIITNFIFIYKIFKSKIEMSLLEKKIFFISFLGMFGFIQSLMLMEVFRNINATIGIFASCLFFLKKKKYFINEYSKIIFISVFIYLLILLNNFSISKYEKSEYEIYNNKYFTSAKKVKKEIKNYYNELESTICLIDNISLINTTNDFAIPYICKNKFIKNKSSMTELFLKTSKFKEYQRIFIKNSLNKNEILISSNQINNLKLISQIKQPHKPREWYGDTYYIYQSY